MQKEKVGNASFVGKGLVMGSEIWHETLCRFTKMTTKMLTIMTAYDKMTVQYGDHLLQLLLNTYREMKHLATTDETVFIMPLGWCRHFPQSTQGMEFDKVQVYWINN